MYYRPGQKKTTLHHVNTHQKLNSCSVCKGLVCAAMPDETYTFSAFKSKGSHVPSLIRPLWNTTATYKHEEVQKASLVVYSCGEIGLCPPCKEAKSSCAPSPSPPNPWRKKTLKGSFSPSLIAIVSVDFPTCIGLYLAPCRFLSAYSSFASFFGTGAAQA